MQINITMRDAKGEYQIPVEIDDPISNDIGEVTIKNEAPRITVFEVLKGHKDKGVKAYTPERGYVGHHEGKRVIFLPCNRENVGVMTDGKPEFSELADNFEKISASIKSARDAVYAEIRASDKKRDDELIAQMQTKVDELLTKIPADHVRIFVESNPDADYDVPTYRDQDGFEVHGRETTVHGWASAIRPGATAAFKSVCIASISAARLAELKEIELVKAEQKRLDKVAAKAKADAEISKRGGYTCTIKKTGYVQGEDGREDTYSITATHPTKPTYHFTARNIFDFGLCVWFDGRTGIATKQGDRWVLSGYNQPDQPLSDQDVEAWLAAHHIAQSSGLGGIRL